MWLPHLKRKCKNAIYYWINISYFNRLKKLFPGAKVKESFFYFAIKTNLTKQRFCKLLGLLFLRKYCANPQNDLFKLYETKAC